MPLVDETTAELTSEQWTRLERAMRKRSQNIAGKPARIVAGMLWKECRVRPAHIEEMARLLRIPLEPEQPEGART